jgi:hypothetical protein
MTNNQENKLRMYFTVGAVCDSNAEVLQVNEAFVIAYRKFQTNVVRIQRCHDILKIENIVSDSFKTIDRVELEETVYYLSGKLKLFAKDTGNDALTVAMNNSQCDVADATDLELVGICNTLTNEAYRYIDDLLGYGITCEGIADLQRFVSNFSINIDRDKTAQTKRNTTEDVLKRLFRENDDILKDTLDKDVEFYRNCDPGFYNNYNEARIVMDLESA